MASELSEARKAVTRGRADEALVHLWNAVEPARLAGDTRELRTIGQLAGRIHQLGDEGQQREAERLLETVQGAVEVERAPEATVALPGGDGDGSFLAEEEAAEEIEEEQGGRGRLSQWLVPLIFLVIIVVNIVARATGD